MKFYLILELEIEPSKMLRFVFGLKNLFMNQETPEGKRFSIRKANLSEQVFEDENKANY
jgi:hypothetical protein